MTPPAPPPSPGVTVMDKDRLAAFADGELSPEEAAAVVMHLSDHPQDQAYVDDLMAANAALALAFGGPLDEPVPAPLRDFILGPAPASRVVPFRGRARGPVVWGGLVLALAAGLAVAVFLPGADVPDLTPGPLAVEGALDAALDTLATGEVQALDAGTEVMILGSVPVPGGYCREMELVRAGSDRFQAALACTRGSGWTVEVVIVENLAVAGEEDGFGTASGDEVQSFGPFLDRIGAGNVLTPAEEAQAMAAGWAR